MTASKIQMDQIRSTSATVTGENIRAGSQKKSSLSPAEGLQGASPDATCTCPSGGGSLRHPCPAHPAVEQAGGDERDFQAEGAQEVPSPVSQEYDRHLISLLRKGEALPGHQEEAADEIERLRDWNDHLNNTVLPNILNPNFLMLMKGGERLLDLCTKDGKFIGVSLNDMKDVFDWMVTHARIAPDHAALAQPSPPPHPASELDFSRPLETENGDPVKWICADVIEYKSARVCVAKDTGLVYSSPYIGLKIRNVMPEQAEAERPEVAEVAFVLRNIGAMDAEDIDGDNVDLRFEDAEGRDTGCDVSIVEYAEKAADLFEQHDRIVGALRAKIAQLRQHKNDYMDAGQETYRALQNEIREREAEIARLDGLVSGRTAERDAALARVKALEALVAARIKDVPVDAPVIAVVGDFNEEQVHECKRFHDAIRAQRNPKAIVVFLNSKNDIQAVDEAAMCAAGWVRAEAPVAQAEQAEAERPEVVAFRYRCTNAEGEPLPGWFYSDDAGTLGLREPLTTVAECDRIVGALRAENERLANDRDRANRFANTAALDNDAALARVAELELGIARIAGDFLPDNSGQAELALDEMRQTLHELLAAIPTQAQHSVPEEFIGRLSEFLAQRGATGKALLRELRAMLAAAPAQGGE
ncbi:TPA: hypothetical protein ACKRXJ_004551 [Pseudomonas aeruginosa]